MSGTSRLAVLAVLGALAMSGCGDDDGDSGAGSGYGGGQQGGENPAETSEDTAKAPPDVVATIEVEETEYKLDPANPGVQDAGKVTFEVTNAGKIAHALEVEGPKGEQETDEIAPGKTATMTVDMSKPGKYTWYCPIADHREQGMEGSVFIAFDKADQTDKPRKEDEKGAGSDGHGGY